jgi:hypothetical protein
MKKHHISIVLLSMLGALPLHGSLTAFQSKHPQERAKYEFTLTSVEAEAYHARGRFIARSGTMSFLKNLFHAEKADAAIKSKIKKSEDLDQRILDDELATFALIRKTLREGDELYIYKFRDGDLYGTGYLIIRGEEIHERWPILTGLSKTEPNQALEPTAPSGRGSS